MSFMGKASNLFRLLCGKKRPTTAAIILAAGLGTRMQSKDGKTKQLLVLGGKPLFMHSVLAFDTCSAIDEIVLVVKKDEAREVRRALKQHKIKTPLRLVGGGETRQESARRGLEAVSESMAYVAVHDAARCLVTPDMIASVASMAYAHRAASAACPMTDTVKQVNEQGFVERTLDRTKLFRAQTPQIFEAKLYRAATYVALEEKLSVTDDNMLLESIGQTVKMVDCGYENIKVTTKEDLLFARAVLQMREEARR